MDKYVAKGINVSCRTINGTAFIFNQETRNLHKLDEVGSFIWDQINGLKTIREITDICCQEFDGDAVEIQQSVQEFIEELYGKNIVEQSSTPFGKEMISAC